MNKLDQHIKNKLTQQQASPLDAWKNIEEKLDNKKKKRIVPFIFWLSSTAACIGIAGIIYFINTSDISENQGKTVSTKTIQKSNHLPETITTPDPIHTDTNNIINIVNNTKENLKSTTYKGEIILNSLLKQNKANENDIIIVEEGLDEITLSTSNQQIGQTNSNSDRLAINNLIENNPLAIEEKTIEEILKEEAEKIKIETKKNDPTMKFAVSTFVSPTMFLKDESILSNSFDTHEIENKISLAYGAKIAYNINDKLKVRTGIAKLDFDQNTKDIVTSRISTQENSTITPLSSNIKIDQNNIKYNGNIQVLTNHDAFPVSFYANEKNTMNQKVEFIEIPLEIEYRLINKPRFNFALIGGGSYMILTKNDIYIDNNRQGRNKLGKAENLNNFSYSANASLKFEYLISDKAGINLEPNYKFLINPLKDFSNKDNSLLGIGLGFSYKF